MAILATLSLAAALACGGTVVGCGSNNSSSGSSGSSGGDSGADTGVPKTDSGQDTGTNTPDSGPLDTGLPDTHVEPQLAAPSFTPAGPAATIESGETVAINPPAGLPTGGQLFYTTSGGVPNSVTGTLYVGPIQVTNAETIVAIAHDPANNFSDSLPASIVLTISLPEGGLPIVTFNPPSESQNNDFLVSLSTTSGGTICYTLDGTTPTCANGVCTGTSETYNAASRVSINGTVTDANTGDVTVTALACEAGQNPSPSASQVYSLIVADPTMVLNGNNVPTGTGVSNVPWPTGQPGLTPTVSTLTNSSIVVTDAVSIWYSTTAAAPTCITGTQTANPTTFGAGGAPILNANTTYQTIGCKQGYLHSNVATFPFTIQMNPPVLAPGGAANPYAYTFTLNTANGPNGISTPAGVVDSANATGGTTTGPGGSPDWVCPVNDASTPKCGATVGTCATATEPVVWANGNPFGTVVVAQTPPNVPSLNNATPTTTITAIACGKGVNPSTSVTTAYTLQLAAAWILADPAGLPANTLPVAGGAPGWNTTTGAPTLGMAIPSGFTNGACPAGQQCFEPLAAFQVPDPGGKACTDEQPTCTTTGAACTESYNCQTGAAANQTPDYYCYIKNATAACGTALGGVASCAVGTAVNPGGGVTFPSMTSVAVAGTYNNAGAALATINAGNVGVSANDKVSVIGCQNAVTEPSGTAVFAPSLPTTVTFSAPGTAVAPGIPTPTGTLTSQAVVTVTNNDTNPSTVCFTVDGSTPKCNAAGACLSNGGQSYCGVSHTTTLAGTVTTAASTTITFSGNQTLAVGTALIFTAQPFTTYYLAAAIANTTGGTLTTAYTGTVGSTTATVVDTSWEAAPLGGCGGTGAVDGSILGAANSATATFTIGNGPSGAGSGTPNGTGLLQKEGEVLNAIACNASEPSSSVSTQTYHFIAATPDFTTLKGTTGNLNGGGSVGAGSCVYVTDTSNFDSALATTPESIHWSWTGAATCGSAGFVDVGSVTGQYPAASVPVWNPAGANSGTGNCAPVPANVTSATLSTIACGENSTIQQSTNTRSATFTITTATPVFTTDQSTCDATQKASLAGCPTNSCYTTVGIAATNTVCPAVTPWDNDVHVLISSPTPNATLCWGTGTVSCSSGNCSGTGVNTVVGGAGGPSQVVTITQTVGANNVLPGSTINAVACTPTILSTSGTATQQFVLQASSVDFVPVGGGAALPCSANNVGMNLDNTDATQDIGGPTSGLSVCWTTDGSAVSTPTCGTAGVGSTTQCSTGTITTVANSLTLTMYSSATLNTLTCKAGYTSTKQNSAYTTTPYRHVITVDGNTSEWVSATTPPGEGTQTILGCANVACPGTPTNADCQCIGIIPTEDSVGLFTYDNTNLYFGQIGDLAGYTPSQNIWMLIIIGNGVSAGAAVTEPVAFGANQIFEPAQTGGLPGSPGTHYALTWETDNAIAPALLVWQQSTQTWQNTSPVVVPKVGYSGTGSSTPNDVEFSVPVASFTDVNTVPQIAAPVMHVTGALYTQVNQTGKTPAFGYQWGVADATGVWYNDTYTSCQSPNVPQP